MSISLETLLPIQGDRDELVQLLNVIGTEWHENEEAFEHRTLAEWPKWCDEQGFRFEVLHKLASNLEDALNYPDGGVGIKQCIAALGPAATAPQLLVSLSQELPEFLEGFDQLLQISQEKSQALGSEAGGTAKQWIKDHPLVAGLATAAAGFTGYKIYRALNPIERVINEDIQQEEEHVEQHVQQVEAQEEYRVEDNIMEIRSDRAVNAEEFLDDSKMYELQLKLNLEEKTAELKERLAKDMIVRFADYSNDKAVRSAIKEETELAGIQIEHEFSNKLTESISQYNIGAAIEINEAIRHEGNLVEQTAEEELSSFVIDEAERIYARALSKAITATVEQIASYDKTIKRQAGSIINLE